MEPLSGRDGLEQKCVLIRTLAKQEKVPLSENIVRYLAESPHEPGSREIKGVLVRFQSYASLMHMELTEEISEALFWEEPGFCDRLAKK